MTHEARILLLFGLLFSLEASVFAAVNRLVFDATNTDGEGLAVDSTGAVIHMQRHSTLNQFLITKTDASGNHVFAVTLKMENSNLASSGTTVNLNNLSGFARFQKSYLTLTSDGNIILVLSATISTTSNLVLLAIKLNGTNGQIDTSYGSNGVASIFDMSTDYLIEAVVVDGNKKTVILFRDTSSGVLTAARYGITGTSDIFTPINTDVLSSVSAGLSIAVGANNDIYVVGKIGTDLFCSKLSASTLTLDTNFGTGGKYSANLSTDANSAVFVAVDSGAIHLLSLNSNDVNFNITSLNSSGVQTTTHAGSFPSAVVLKNAFRTSGGKYYIGGTINSGGETAFWSRFTASGGSIAGDTTFATSGDANYIANGIAKVPVTAGATVASGAGGILGYNSTTNTVAVGFKETLSGVTRFVRDFGTEAGSFLTASETIITPSVVTGSAPVRPVNGGRRDAAFNRNTVTGSNVTSINDAGITVTAYDDVIAYLRSGDNFILSKINEQGSLETDFGSGARLIKVRSTGGSTSTAAIANLSEVISGKPAYITHDLNKNILVAFQVNVAGGNPYFVIMRLDKDTGLLDTTFGIGGIVVLSPGYAVCQVDGIAVDSAGKIVMLLYVENGGNKFPMVIFYDNSGNLVFNTTLSGSITNAVAGMTLKLDVDNNIFIAGKYGAASPYGLFCMKLNNDGTIHTAFGTSGKYTTGALAELTTISSVFLSVYQFDDKESIQIATQVTGGVFLAQLSLLGVPGTVFSGSHTNFIQINNITTLN